MAEFMETRPDRIADSHLSDRTPIGTSIARVMTCPKCQSTPMEEGEVVLKKPALDWLLFKVGLIRCGVVKPLVRSVGGHRRCYRPIETRALPIAEAILILPSLFPI